MWIIYIQAAVTGAWLFVPLAAVAGAKWNG